MHLTWLVAHRLAELVKARVVGPECMLWQCAVDQVLVRLVDSHPQVSKPCIRPAALIKLS
jgi:hypothetical protein